MSTNDFPLISVIMPVYNVAPFIAKAIRSVLDQTYKNFELLIIDDGTPDDSIAVALPFKERDERITILHKPNGGLSDARNFGMQHAKGSYYYFIDSDDWIEPQLLQSALSEILTYQCDVILFGYFKDSEDSSGATTDSIPVTCPKNTFKKSDLSNFTIDATMLNIMGYAWNKLYRAAFLKSHNFKFEKGISLVEDILFNAKVLGATDKIIILDQPLYHYMIRNVETLITTFHQNSFDLVLQKLAAIEKFLQEWNVGTTVKSKILAQTVVEGIRYCVNNIFAYKNQLNLKEKKNYVNMMITHPETVKYIKYYEPVSNMDALYKKLIQQKMSSVLTLLCLIKK